MGADDIPDNLCME